MIHNNLREANLARQRLWDEGSVLTLSYFGNALAGEMGEACNEIKKLEREALGLKGSRTTQEKLGDELADVVIYMDLLCAKLGLDLEAAIERKFNATSAKVGFNVLLKFQES